MSRPEAIQFDQIELPDFGDSLTVQEFHPLLYQVLKHTPENTDIENGSISAAAALALVATSPDMFMSKPIVDGLAEEMYWDMMTQGTDHYTNGYYGKQPGTMRRLQELVCDHYEALGYAAADIEKAWGLAKAQVLTGGEEAK